MNKHFVDTSNTFIFVISCTQLWWMKLYFVLSLCKRIFSHFTKIEKQLYSSISLSVIEYSIQLIHGLCVTGNCISMHTVQNNFIIYYCSTFNISFHFKKMFMFFFLFKHCHVSKFALGIFLYSRYFFVLQV